MRMTISRYFTLAILLSTSFVAGCSPQEETDHTPDTKQADTGTGETAAGRQEEPKSASPKEITDKKEARAIFIEVVKIERMPAEQQKKKIEHLYRNFYLRFKNTIVALPPDIPNREIALKDIQENFLPKPLKRPKKIPGEKESPEELADRLGKPGWARLVIHAKEKCLKVLRDNLETLKPLIKEDLKAKDDTSTERALKIVGDLRLKCFFDEVLAVFKGTGKLSYRAAYTLRDIHDPRAIRHLVEKNKENSMLYFELLRNLQYAKPADPVLVRLLKSDDPEVRWRATYALAESGDESLIPEAKRLMKDLHPLVRKYAANMGFLMKGNGYKQLKPDLVKLLSDLDVSVRLFIAVCFAQRRDKVCAHALLDLIKDGSMDELWHSNVWQAINNLAGTYFGYYHGSDAWQPTTENNKAAIKRFEEWIRKYANRE